MRVLLLVILGLLSKLSLTIAPTWITSPFVKADWKKIISTKTGNTSTPTGTLTFSAPAFTAVPNLGYGISNYDGDDSLYSQMFQVNRTGLTTTSFSVIIQIHGYTNIWVLEVRYVAIDKAFPHHLNSFDNVPINYTKGALTNISTPSSTPQIYTNTINYTAQTTALGMTYKKFSLPLTNNKVLLFMTSMYITGILDKSSPFYPVNLVVTSNPTTNQTYTLTVNASKNISITRLHFSMIVFDQADVQSSGKYLLVYARVDFTNTGGFYGFPAQFISNFMIGLTDLSSNKTMSAIVFDTQFVTSPSEGINKPAQNCRNSSYIPAVRYGMTAFYIKTWICPNGTFFNSNTNDCQGCAVANCLVCTSATTCTKCNQAAGYYLKSATQCQICAMAGCINCSGTVGGGGCSDCNQNIGYVLDTATYTCTYCNPAANQFVAPNNLSCVTCAIDQCTTCSSLTQCSVCNILNSSYVYPDGTCHYCNPADNTFINATTLKCEECALSNCITCSSLSTCSVCNTAALYLLNSSNLCQLCTLPYCALCSTLSTCSQCSTGYVINPTFFTCEICTLQGCLNCLDAVTCTQCDISSNYITTGPTCLRCDTNNSFFANESTNTCEQCTIANCTTCASLTACLVCDYNASYTLSHDGSCAYCNNSIDHFINPATLECDACTIPNCLNCSSLTTCEQCNQANKYELNTSDWHCYLCTLVECLDCGSLTECLLCNNSAAYFMNYSLNVCQPCILQGCLTCQQLDICSQCDAANNYGPDNTSPNLTLCGTCNVSCTCDGYTLPWRGANCTPSCGDGLIRLQQQCDDNNTVDGDGCSSTCTQQPYYNCTSQPSNCTLMLYIQAQFVDIRKDGCNGMKITVKVPHFQLAQITQNILIINQGITITNTQQNQSYIEIYAQYTRDVVNQSILLHFSPGDVLNISYSPSIPALYYSKSQCAAQQQIQTMLQALQVISYVILITSILSCKIVGLQLFGVLQLSYFTLSSHDFLNIYLRPLTQFRTFNGLNVGVVNENASTQQMLPQNYRQMSVASTFINNCNIMLIVLFGELLISVGMYIVGRIIRHASVQKIGLRLLKQGFITLVLFNILNISFSAGVHWRYASPSDPSYTWSSILLYGTLLTMVVSVFAMQLTSKQDYGQFKNKYKKVWICQMYVPLTVVYRMIIGLYIALQGEHELSTLIVLAFELMFLLYIAVNLPFTNVYQNYRCALVHVTMFVILLTTNYYRSMKSNTELEVKGKIFGPAMVELVLIVTVIGVSFFVLVYEIYQLIKVWKNGKKAKIENRKRHDTDESFGQL